MSLNAHRKYQAEMANQIYGLVSDQLCHFEQSGQIFKDDFVRLSSINFCALSHEPGVTTVGQLVMGYDMGKSDFTCL